MIAAITPGDIFEYIMSAGLAVICLAFIVGAFFDI